MFLVDPPPLDLCRRLESVLLLWGRSRDWLSVGECILHSLHVVCVMLLEHLSPVGIPVLDFFLGTESYLVFSRVASAALVGKAAKFEGVLHRSFTVQPRDHHCVREFVQVSY